MISHCEHYFYSLFRFYLLYLVNCVIYNQYRVLFLLRIGLKMSKVYRWCILSHCKNTSVKMPEKVFIQVPSEKTSRELWLAVAGRDMKEFSPTISLFVCEDHFDLPNDMDNYLKWKTMGGLKRMKKGVVPHKNLALVPEVEGREAKVPRYNLSEDISSASSTQVLSLDTEFSDDFKEMEQSKKEENADKVNYKDVATSAKPHYRSKYTQTVSRLVDTSSSPLKTITEEKSTSPMKHGLKPLKKGFMKPAMLMFSSDTPDVPSAASTSTVHFGPHSSSNDQCSLDAPHTSSNDPDSIDEEKAVELALKLTMRNINLNPKRYLGISKDSLWIIPEIKEHTGLDDVSIYLILKKIKTAHTFAELADDFGISESSATRIFRNGVPLLSPIMKELIVWPSNDSIKSQLPKAFRARYGNVESIIDCLEIEISKPSDPVKQALTWSEYKKANTVKYLISSTPDGIINFISKGFGGRATDQTIVENSGYLDALKPGVVVMADRGFKNIDKLLYDKQCTLVRPPSVGSGDKLTKNEVLTTKRIASLRIHIERVIRRLREHKFLKTHACIHSKLISLTDHIMIIACGLTNLQKPLIK